VSLEMGEFTIMKMKSNPVAVIWELIGIIAIFFVIKLPSGKNFVDIIFQNTGYVQGRFAGATYGTLVSMMVFILVYLTSHRLFPTDKCTRLFFTAVPSFMIISILSLIVF
jgi:hypothetical protein